MRFPDFFIIGAPKCGTTSLYEYLRPHPRIFMSWPKEPNYYFSDNPARRRVATRDAYAALFERAPAGAVCGEASPWYLYSHRAVGSILEDNPKAKLIVCLRNPVDMFVSLHSQILYNQETDEEPDVEKAWRRQAQSRNGTPVASLQPDYPDVCSLGGQVQRLLNRVNRDQVRFLLFEDLNDARGAYETVLEFLEIESDGRTHFPVHNERKTHRFPALSRFLMHPPFPFDRIKSGVRKAVLAVNPNPGNFLNDAAILSKPAARPVLRPEFHDELVAYVADAVSLLERLTGRDRSAWRV